jgi:hypothetical protein
MFQHIEFNAFNIIGDLLHKLAQSALYRGIRRQAMQASTHLSTAFVDNPLSAQDSIH